LRFADAFASASKVFLSLVMLGFLPALPENGFYEDLATLVSDSFHAATVLSLPIVSFPMLGSIDILH
jgi:hypothetical protein